jgi:DNA-binding response OmpR family regulator
MDTRPLRGSVVVAPDRVAAPPDVYEPGLHVAILESALVDRASLVAIAEEQGWAARTYATYADLLADVDAGWVAMLVLSFADVAVCHADLSRMLSLIDGPVVVLTEHDRDLKTALRLGASLAMRKPFDPELLQLSLLALMRRRESFRWVFTESTTLIDLKVRVANHTIERNGRRQVLSPTEWQLFAFLLAHPGRTFSRSQLSEGAWGIPHGGRIAQIDLYVYRLRKKVERDPRNPQIITTVRHEGYRLTPVSAK